MISNIKFYLTKRIVLNLAYVSIPFDKNEHPFFVKLGHIASQVTTRKYFLDFKVLVLRVQFKDK